MIRAELAMTTFVYTAQDWWGAHRQRNPSLRVTFTQLCEWLTTELVPSASHASVLEAWTCLDYRGDLEQYFKQLDDLRSTTISTLALLTRLLPNLLVLSFRLEFESWTRRRVLEVSPSQH